MPHNNFLVLLFARWRKRHQPDPLVCPHGELAPRGFFAADCAYWCGNNHIFDGRHNLTCPCGSEQVTPVYARPKSLLAIPGGWRIVK